MTARARRSSARVTISTGSGTSLAPNPQFWRRSSRSSASSADGKVECFDVTENEHRDHILKVSRAPAAIPDELAKEAISIAERIADSLEYVGVLAVEMFVLK